MRRLALPTPADNLVAGFTGPQSTVPVPGLVQQVNAYLATKPKTDGSIYALVIGANDVRSPSSRPR